ncbi:MAG TPA: PP2C family serine/threonine-protein phosphatase [Burkholderiaceae bacterium]|nr:PP2C family serine/threonine-protein phosphatase [Burkholderiaceae bacterium]
MSTESSTMRWSSASRSHPGRVREVNEDACLEQPRCGVWAVADGMGGHSLGEFASRLAIRSLMDLPTEGTLEQRASSVEARLLDANRRLRAEAARRDVPVIGTTIATLLVAENRFACVWAGDSRIYLFRDGRLRQLTRDHSQLEAIRSLHVGSSDDTLDRPPANVITRALGGDDQLELDAVGADVADGDVFLLCSDGLSNEVSEAAIVQALMPGGCRLAAEALVDMALERGGHDNITAVVVRAEDLSSPDRTLMHPVLHD